MTPYNFNRVVLTRATAERSFLNLSIEFLIFPDFQAFFHKLAEQTNRIAPSLPGRFFKAFPYRRI
jgi:hypothetical protein